MKQISIFFSKNEVFEYGNFLILMKHCETLLLIIKYTVAKPYPIIALNLY